MKNVLFIVRTAPHGSAAVPESIRTCLGFGTMPFDIGYVLLDDATWAVLPNQRPESIGGNDALELISNLTDLGVRLYVESDALAERGLSVAGIEPEFVPLSQVQISDLIASADVVRTY